MTGFDLPGILRTIAAADHGQTRMIAERLAHEYAEAHARFEAQYKTIAILRDLNRRTDTVVNRIALNHAITHAHADNPNTGDVLADEHDQLAAAFATIVAIVDRAHLHDTGPRGIPTAASRCMPACRICQQLADIPARFLADARTTNRRIH